MDETYYFESTSELYDYMKENKYEVNQYIYDKIRKHLLLDDEIETMPLFYYEHEGLVLKIEISLNPKNLITPLKHCLDSFTEIEEYEKCSECLNLIKSIS
jgi:protein-arginine kinase activator protein McsA